MRKLSVLLIICMIVCALPLTSLADAVSVSDEGVVTYSNDFEDEYCKVNEEYTNDTQGLHWIKSSSTATKFMIRGNNTKYLELQQTKAGYPSMMVNFLKTDASPKINSLAGAKKYKVTFRMRFIPLTAKKSLQVFCGGFWNFYVNGSGTTYSIYANGTTDTKVGEVTYNCKPDVNDTTINKFINYEIDVDKEANTATFKVGGKVIYKNVEPYTGSDGTKYNFDSLIFKYSAMTGNTAVDDIKVTVTDKAECSDTNYASATKINFDDFGIGIIPNSPETKIGGFENDNEQTGYAYIDYTYNSETPSEVNKFLTIKKSATEKKPFSIKRDISGVVGDCSEYDISFKIKNDLDKNGTAFIRLADGSNSNEGAVISITQAGTIGLRDYKYDASDKDNSWKNFVSKVPAGEWTEIKARIYKDENKADLYVGDMENPIVQNIKTNRTTIGDYIVFAPQKSATGSISVDNIVITPVTKSDYVLTYTTGSDDLAKYTSNGVSAQCKITNESAQIPVIIIAEYGADGRLVNIAKSESAQDGTISATLSSAGAQTGENVSVMLWKSLDDPVPLKKLIKLSPVVQ